MIRAFAMYMVIWLILFRASIATAGLPDPDVDPLLFSAPLPAVPQSPVFSVAFTLKPVPSRTTPWRPFSDGTVRPVAPAPTVMPPPQGQGVAQRPFVPAPVITPATTARPAAPHSTSFPGIMLMGHTTIGASAAGHRGGINCATG